MRGSLAFAAIAGLLCPGFAQAQELITSPVPTSARVAYDRPTSTPADAALVVLLDQREFLVTSNVCAQAAVNGSVACEATPEPAFFDVVNTPPFPHRLDALFRSASQGASVPASTVRVTPPQPPAPTMCPYVTLAGVSSPKAIGNDDVRGWNPIDTTDLVAVRAFYARLKQLRAWGLDATALVVDDGTHVATAADGKPVHVVTGKPWAYIYAPCVGPPQ